MSKEELIPALIFYWVIFSIGYRFLGYNFALHFSGFGKEEFKKIFLQVQKAIGMHFGCNLFWEVGLI